MFRSTRVKWVARILLILFLWVSGVFNLEVFRQQVVTQSGYDPAAASERRFQQVRSALAGVDRVGYISEEAPSDDRESGAKRYFLAQYALAPVVVELGTSANLIIGSFAGAGPSSVPNNLLLVRDFGAGILLFQRRYE